MAYIKCIVIVLLLIAYCKHCNCIIKFCVTESDCADITEVCCAGDSSCRSTCVNTTCYNDDDCGETATIFCCENICHRGHCHGGMPTWAVIVILLAVFILIFALIGITCYYSYHRRTHGVVINVPPPAHIQAIQAATFPMNQPGPYHALPMQPAQGGPAVPMQPATSRPVLPMQPGGQPVVKPDHNQPPPPYYPQEPVQQQNE